MFTRFSRPLLHSRGNQIRWHMSHGDSPHKTAVSSASGPRQPVTLGLDAAKSTSNLVRLTESSHGFQMSVFDNLSTVWHPRGLLWQHENSNNQWSPMKVHSVGEDGAIPGTNESKNPISRPRLLSLTLSDDRTALVKLVGSDGRSRFISLLRFDPAFIPTISTGRMGGDGMLANDGWYIVREIVGAAPTSSNNNTRTCYESLTKTLETYLTIEHGGGSSDAHAAETLFDPNASLVSIGTLPLEEQGDARSEWSAPVGSLLEISQSTYVAGVANQTPHEDASKVNDAIHTLDVLPCGLAAAATVQVGNGACDTLFCDHLLLGRPSTTSTDWKILSKTFSPQPWPHHHHHHH